jgi:putative sigma-54 modulation protein
MDVQIEGRHVEVTSSIREHVESKVQKIRRYFDGIINLHVVLTMEKSKRFCAEWVCQVARGGSVVGKSESGDLYAACDAAFEKVKEGLKKYKDRLRVEPRRTGSARMPAQPTETVGEEEEENE